MLSHQEAGCIDLCCRKDGRGAFHQCSWEQGSSEQCYRIAFGTWNAEGYKPEQDCHSPSFADSNPHREGPGDTPSFFSIGEKSPDQREVASVWPATWTPQEAGPDLLPAFQAQDGLQHCENTLGLLSLQRGGSSRCDHQLLLIILASDLGIC